MTDPKLATEESKSELIQAITRLGMKLLTLNTENSDLRRDIASLEDRINKLNEDIVYLQDSKAAMIKSYEDRMQTMADTFLGKQ